MLCQLSLACMLVFMYTSNIIGQLCLYKPWACGLYAIEATDLRRARGPAAACYGGEVDVSPRWAKTRVEGPGGHGGDNGVHPRRDVDHVRCIQGMKRGIPHGSSITGRGPLPSPGKRAKGAAMVQEGELVILVRCRKNGTKGRQATNKVNDAMEET